MRKLLLSTTAALGLMVSAGAANATLTYTVWSGPNILDHAAEFPLPTQDKVSTFSDPGNPINFADTAGPSSPNLFSSFFTPAVLSEFVAGGGNASASMSTSDQGSDISTFIEITGSYNIASTFAGSIDHDDGGQIFLDGATAMGSQLCGNPAENSETTQSCSFLAGAHSFTVLYTEDNGAPSILRATVPPTLPVPEPTSLALFGTALVGLGVLGRRRNRRNGDAAV